MRTLQMYDAVFVHVHMNAHFTDVGSPFMATWFINAQT